MGQLKTFHAGHNFYVTGAHANGYKEEVETRRVVQRIAELCEENGINYAITTDNDGRTQRQNLNNIIANCNSHTKDRVDVAIHFNQATSEKGGVEVWYYDQRELAAKVSEAVAGALGIANRGPKQGKELAVLNGTNAPAILIEVAFLNNPGNMQAYEQRFEPLCRAIVQSVTGVNLTNYQPLPTAKADKYYRVNFGDFDSFDWLAGVKKRVSEILPGHGCWIACLAGNAHRILLGDYGSKEEAQAVIDRLNQEFPNSGIWLEEL
ncbi:N-acetylmuramoyl-L-alanine amidase [Bacillus paranthracis]|uniref:N-acetylmuramoyl-L-alanine amidase n=1 Tax=Bacillus paranthracis TaxID=2026186 RepID=UPI0021CEE284|nr:N-acetylmuramoyl-L-alanine amidase [Bacillus paranthracis]MCU5568109.1 N-acetylmuramoyl-L-alanine amidase [Bacillus paranthracis]